jgi:biopolymer transport protein ExbD
MGIVRTIARREGVEPPVDSFSDIAFLLIIFFILVTSLSQLTGLQTEMPAAEKSEAQPEKTPTVALSEGRLLFNDEAMTLEVLRTQLAGLALAGKADGDNVVLLEASGKVPYQDYYQVMAAISAAGGVIGILQEETQ